MPEGGDEEDGIPEGDAGVVFADLLLLLQPHAAAFREIWEAPATDRTKGHKFREDGVWRILRLPVAEQVCDLLLDKFIARDSDAFAPCFEGVAEPDALSAKELFGSFFDFARGAGAGDRCLPAFSGFAEGWV